MKHKIQTASDLKFWHEYYNPESQFFSRQTMKFFGDTIKNLGVSTTGEHIWLHRKRPTSKAQVGNGWYFNKETFKQVWPKE